MTDPVPRPAHVPADRLVDVDVMQVPGGGDDYHRGWADLQAASPPLVWTPRNEGHWIALSGEILAEVQADWKRFSNRVIVLPKSLGEHHRLIPTTIDPPDHRPYRKLLNENLAPGAIRGLEQSITAAAVGLIDAFIDDGGCNFTTQYAEIFPIRIFLSLMDMPESHSEQLRHWATCMTRPGQDMTFEEAKAAFYAYVDPVVQERRDNPGSDMVSMMLQSRMTMPDGGERRLNHQEALSLVTQVLIAGVDTVVNFLGFTMLALAEDKLLRDRLRADPDDILPAVNEFFRRFGLVTIAREVRADMVFHGMTLKAGEMVAIPTVVHGIDPAVNADPLTIDLDRKRGRHSAFGSGPHMCPGQELARREVAITIREWLHRIPDFHVAQGSVLASREGIVASLERLKLAWDAPGNRSGDMR
ncbi:cytochrome P450 [Croceicoccus sp. F390]|uniref:Cytochrome P450 n=1 Tax=Croceicoccus esteveae TaxID=3075597 RepID=A0ABU2ZHB2_9SPHN|nr:cytochrome P450 [Croceicoccus sp. F390]MDT0575993.1 cytochrome P450 [Croceicoccus sp. F390]